MVLQFNSLTPDEIIALCSTGDRNGLKRRGGMDTVFGGIITESSVRRDVVSGCSVASITSTGFCTADFKKALDVR